LKAVVVGCVFIAFTILVLQLVYIFAAVAYNALAKDYEILNDIVGIFRYLIGIPVFIAIMFAGGYITASVAEIEARIKVLSLSMSVGLITAGAMIIPTLEGASLTTTGIVIFLLAILATTAGGLYWQKEQVAR
jgi:hypothetical protein